MVFVCLFVVGFLKYFERYCLLTVNLKKMQHEQVVISAVLVNFVSCVFLGDGEALPRSSLSPAAFGRVAETLAVCFLGAVLSFLAGCLALFLL